MKQFIISIILLTTAIFAASGCANMSLGPSSINLNTAYHFEKRYTTEDSITINGEKIEFAADQSIWVLSNSTLKNLLESAAGKNVTEIK